MRECAVASPTPDSSTPKRLSSSRQEASIARVLPRNRRPSASRIAAGLGPIALTCRRRIERDRHQRELAVLARRQIDLAAQLVLEMDPAGTARWRRRAASGPAFRGAVASVGQLLLLELCERRSNCASLPLRREVDPDAGQQRRLAIRDGRHAGDGELAPHAHAADVRCSAPAWPAPSGPPHAARSAPASNNRHRPCRPSSRAAADSGRWPPLHAGTGPWPHPSRRSKSSRSISSSSAPSFALARTQHRQQRAGRFGTGHARWRGDFSHRNTFAGSAGTSRVA